jgi:hypothetical protein
LSECFDWSDGEDHDGEPNALYNYEYIRIGSPPHTQNCVAYLWSQACDKPCDGFLSDNFGQFWDENDRQVSTVEFSVANEWVSSALQRMQFVRDIHPHPIIPKGLPLVQRWELMDAWKEGFRHEERIAELDRIEAAVRFFVA